MAQPVTHELIYSDMVGPAYPATPSSIRNVLATMQAAADHPWNSVRVRFRFADAAPVVVSPRRKGRR
jgi:hypothetical protein